VFFRGYKTKETFYDFKVSGKNPAIYYIYIVSPTKKILLIVSILCLPLLLLIIGRLFKAYVIYTIPTTAMYPAVKPGQVVFGSCLLKAKKGDMIAYHSKPTAFDPVDSDYLCRIVGTEGDTLQISAGNLYINGELADDTMNLAYMFHIENSEFGQLTEKQKNSMLFYYGDSVVLNGTYSELASAAIKAKRVLSQHKDIDPAIFKSESTESWSIDDFGPVIIPEGKVFLMGDNRSNSADSRYRGFIAKEDIVATIVK
jgi:signal peptidase I